MKLAKHHFLFIIFVTFSSILYGQEKYKVTASVLNVRSQPNVNSTILGSVKMNDLIDVISIENNWAKFNYRNNTAYVSCKYLEKIETFPKNTINNDSINQNNTFTNKNNIIHFRIIPSISFGYSNFIVKKVSAKPILNFGADIALHFIFNETFLFLPKNYYIETSIGYSLKGSRSIPLHYFDLTLSPIGYIYDYKDYRFTGCIGNYFGTSSSKVRTNKYSFDTNFDIGLYWKLGVEYLNKIFISVSGEHGLRRICDANLKMKNITIQIHISYNLKHLIKKNKHE